MKRYWKKTLLLFAVSFLAEIILFQHGALFSWNASNQALAFTREGNTFYAEGMEGKPGYLYVGIEHRTEDGSPLPVSFTISIRDEGNAAYYELPEVTLYPPVEKSKYLRIHSYGEVRGLRISVNDAAEGVVDLTGLIYDARVPWSVSLLRMGMIFAVLVLAWGLRPGSGIYKWEWKPWQKGLAIGILLGFNMAFLFFLVRSNPAFLKPVWPYHQQYQLLAESLSQGKVNIEIGDPEILQGLLELDNPYDYGMRASAVSNVGNVWDVCYFDGHFYVYFGIVPVLVFYLPYYLLFHGGFPTWLAVFLSACGAISGMYYLLGIMRRRWFPKLPFALYLVIAFVMSNSLNLFSAILHADFYCVPILLALCFSLWGLGLVLSAACDGKSGSALCLKLGLGALLLALTAGCRPQFLVGSALALWFVLPLLLSKKEASRGVFVQVKRIAVFVLPYVLVAAGLMYYNYVRFGSAFDFGANYNLTTNDMTRRGLELGRLPDGVFMYLFQSPSLRLTFPFVEVTAFYSNYLGTTIKDWTYGGAFWTHAVFLGVFAAGAVRKELKPKRLFGPVLLCIGMSVLVVVADTEMAGILNRYYTDFLWLLAIPAAMILMQLLEGRRGGKAYEWILWFVLLAGAWGILYELGAAFRGSGIMNDNAHRYYLIKSLFQ